MNDPALGLTGSAFPDEEAVAALRQTHCERGQTCQAALDRAVRVPRVIDEAKHIVIPDHPVDEDAEPSWQLNDNFFVEEFVNDSFSCQEFGEAQQAPWLSLHNAKAVRARRLQAGASE